MATPVRNVRIPDSMWEKLGNLAYKRKTTITALLVEGAEFILDAGGYSKPDPPSTEALQQELQALALRVKELEGQLGGQVSTEAPTSNVSDVPPADEALTQTVNALTQRLDRIESTIAPLIQALEQVPQVGGEEVGVEEADVEELENDVNVDSESKLESTPLPPTLEYPLSQRQLSERLGQRYSYYLQKHRERGKEHFEAWSQGLDPDGITWTFEEPKRRRGKVSSRALKFYPKR